MATLAKYTATSERRVQQIVAELTETGELFVESAAGPGGTNIYWVTVSCPEDCDRTSAHRGVKPASGGGEAHFTGGVKPTSPKPSLEPLENQRKRATRLTDEWKPSGDLLAWAAGEYPDLDVKGETECFIDYWVAKPSNATKLDWDRTWKSWMRRAGKRTATRRPRRTAAEDNWDVVRRFQQGAIDE